MSLNDHSKNDNSLGSTDMTEKFTAFLRKESFDRNRFGRLAADLFSKEKCNLAAIVFDRWTQEEPLNPEPWSNLGLALSRCGELSSAVQALSRAHLIDPKYLPAINNLAAVYQLIGDYDNQLLMAQTAVDLDPSSALALNNLGTALLEHGRLPEAKASFVKSLAIDPRYFEAHFNLARVDSDEGRHDAAIQFLERAQTSVFANIQHYRAMIEYHLSFEYLTTGRLREGWELYERGFSSAISTRIARLPRRSFNVPVWSGEALKANERVMVWREQGVGDEIRFAALIPLLPQSIQNNLLLECDERLENLFARSMPQLKVRSHLKTASDFHYHLPIGSLPRLLMGTADVLRDSPELLYPDPTDVEIFSTRLSAFRGKKLVGICWRSHQLSAARNKKYTELRDWYEILATPNIVFVNLQYGDCEGEIRHIESALGIAILRWDDLDIMNDFNSVAALLKNLDMVVSVSSAIVPLAGAVGAPTICMTHQNWILLNEKDKYPWFSSVKPIVVPLGEPIATALPKVQNLICSLAKSGVTVID